MNTEAQIMTPEEQKIAIMMHMGWRFTFWGKDQVWVIAPPEFRPHWWRRDERYEVKWPCNGKTVEEAAHQLMLEAGPDYLNDLNAMHGAEATIRGDARWQTYKKELRDICDSAYPCEDPYHAPAKLRAEAFLRTIKEKAPKL